MADNARTRRAERRKGMVPKYIADQAAAAAEAAAKAAMAEAVNRRRFFAEQFASKYIMPHAPEFEKCVLGEIDRLCSYEHAMLTPETKAEYDARLVEFSPHPAWFADCTTETDVLDLLAAVFVFSMSDKRPHSNPRSYRTQSDFAVVARQLCDWVSNVPRTFKDLRRVSIDGKLYRSFVSYLCEDAYRYVSPIPIQRLQDYRARSKVRQLVQMLPEACLYCNGDPAQQIVWPRDALEDHLFDVLNYVPAPNELGHPRPFVSRLVKEAIVKAL